MKGALLHQEARALRTVPEGMSLDEERLRVIEEETRSVEQSLQETIEPPRLRLGVPRGVRLGMPPGRQRVDGRMPLRTSLIAGGGGAGLGNDTAEDVRSRGRPVRHSDGTVMVSTGNQPVSMFSADF